MQSSKYCVRLHNAKLSQTFVGDSEIQNKRDCSGRAGSLFVANPLLAAGFAIPHRTIDLDSTRLVTLAMM